MQLAGDEKKIRALFSELAHEEAQAAPRFDKLWRDALRKDHVAARQTPEQQAPRFSKSLAVLAVTLLVAVAVLFVAWSAAKTPEQQNAQTTAPPAIQNQASPQPESRQNREPANKTAVVRPRTHSYSTHRRTLAQRQQSTREREQRALEQQAALLANWKSPTESFVTSPTRAGFDSLPQLNEAAKDLQSFLQKKESNQ
jgi:hypothetical protein